MYFIDPKRELHQQHKKVCSANSNNKIKNNSMRVNSPVFYARDGY